jgi:hypothetical protein
MAQATGNQTQKLSMSRRETKMDATLVAMMITVRERPNIPQLRRDDCLGERPAGKDADGTADCGGHTDPNADQTALEFTRHM